MKSRKKSKVKGKAKARKPSPNPLRLDPSRTLTMRRVFEREIRKQFASLKGDIIRVIQVEDAFGLNTPQQDPISNVFCATGSGGGVDPTCGKEGSSTARKKKETPSEKTKRLLAEAKEVRRKSAETVEKVRKESKDEKRIREAREFLARSAKTLERIKKENEEAAKRPPTVVEPPNLDYLEPWKGEDNDGPTGTVGKENLAKVRDIISRSKNLTDEQRESYAVAMRNVLGRMPEKVHEAISSSLGKVKYYGSADEIGPAAIDDIAHEMSKDMVAIQKNKYKTTKAVGIYNNKTGNLYLDGDTEDASAGFGRYAGQLKEHIYAHEITHAIDGLGLPRSKSAEWSEAYSREINIEDAPLTHYAKVSASEGFAEFGRLLYGGGVPLDKVEQTFPKAATYFKKNGLWPV